jgi:hypothetical protein
MLDGHIAAGEVDEAAGDEEGRDAARAALDEGRRGLVDAADAADAGADQHAGGALVLIRLGLPAGIAKRHRGRRHGIDDEGVDLALLLRLHPLVGVEGAVGAVATRDLAGDLTGQVIDLEIRDLAGAALPLDKAGPSGIDPAAQRRDHAKTCDNYPAHEFLPYRLIKFGRRVSHPTPGQLFKLRSSRGSGWRRRP